MLSPKIAILQNLPMDQLLATYQLVHPLNLNPILNQKFFMLEFKFSDKFILMQFSSFLLL